MLGRLLGRNSKDSNDDEMPQEPQRTTKVNLEDVQKRILIGSDAIVELDKHYKGLTSADADQQEIKSVISEIRQNFDRLLVLSEKQSAYNEVEEEMQELLSLATGSLKMLTKKKKSGLVFRRQTDNYVKPRMKHYKKLQGRVSQIHTLQLKHSQAVFKDELFNLVRDELEPMDPNKEFIRFDGNGVLEKLPESFKGGGRRTRKHNKRRTRKQRKSRHGHGSGQRRKSTNNRRNRRQRYTRNRR